MTLRSIATRLLPPILVPKAWSSPFEAANWSSRRGSVPGAAPTDARDELTSGVRAELVRKSRYLHKNSGSVGTCWEGEGGRIGKRPEPGR